MTLALDSAGFQTVANVSFEQLLLDRVKPIQEKKMNQMNLDLRAKVENQNIFLYVQTHHQGILSFWDWKTRSFPPSDIKKAKIPWGKGCCIHVHIMHITYIHL